MKSASPNPPSGAIEILREIDVLVEELARLACSQVTPSEFYTQLLQRAAFTLSAEGAAVWTIGAASELQLSFQYGLAHLQSKRANKLHECEISRLQPIVSKSQSEILPSRPSEGLASWIVACPILVGELTWGILTVHVSEEVPQAVKQGYQRFVVELAQIAADYQQRHDFSAWQINNASWKGFSEFCLSTHRAWSLNEVAFQIANEGRRYIGCDRLSVVQCWDRRSKLLAVSGVDAVHTHANQVRKLEQLVQAATRTRQPFLYDENTENIPPQIETLLNSYLDEGATRNIMIIPLFHDEQPGRSQRQLFAAIVCEQFRDNTLTPEMDRLQPVSQQATVALSRAVRVRNVPLLGFLAQHSSILRLTRTQTWPLWALGLLLLGIVAAILSYLPADFHVVARGQFQPVLQRHIFAALDGTVDKLLIEQNQVIEKGEPVVELTSIDLDIEFQRISGEMAVARKELMANRAEQLQTSGFDSKTTSRIQNLSAQELTLNEQLNSLAIQLNLLNKQREQLKLSSPIRGRVLTWELESTLLARPVRRGNILFTIADTDGPWVIRFNVPDSSAGHVLTASEASKDALSVSFVSVSEPGKTYQGAIKKISTTSQVDVSERTNGVLVEVDFDKNLVGKLQAGATVVGKIHCGRRAIGYVWLHEFFEELDRRFF